MRQGVYLMQNTSQAASVEFVRQRRTNYARSRLQKLAEKPVGLFRHAQITGQPKADPLFQTVKKASQSFLRKQKIELKTFCVRACT